MATEILVNREGQRLVPYDAMAAEEVERLGSGPFMVKITKPRSLPHHRLYFACLNAMAKAGAATSADDLHDATKMKSGLARVAQMPNGEWFAFSDSTAFNRMDQISFNAFFDKALTFWKASKLWGYLPPDLQAKLEAGERQ